jgi:hypothetical protein
MTPLMVLTVRCRASSEVLAFSWWWARKLINSDPEGTFFSSEEFAKRQCGLLLVDKRSDAGIALLTICANSLGLPFRKVGSNQYSDNLTLDLERPRARE